MERGSRPRSMKVASEAWLIALATLSAIFLAVIATSHDAGRPAHEAVMINLRAVDVNHASLQRDVLRARAGLLMSYDPLVESVIALRKTAATLENLFASSDFGSDGRLEKLLSQLKSGIDADEALVEDFKTRNALLQNSVGVFGQTLTDLHQSSNETVRSALDNVGDLGNLMMRFSTRPDPELEKAIGKRLQRLSQSVAVSPAARQIQTLTTHAKMILAILPTVDEKVASVLASRTPKSAELLQSQYLDAAGQANSRAAASRILLGATAIALCIYVFVLVYRLRNQTERLKRRLHYEQAIAGIKAEMFNTSPRDFPEFMDRALRVLTCLFEGSCSGFAILNIDTGEMKNVHRHGGDTEDYRTLLIDFAHDSRRHWDASPSGCEDSFAYVNLTKTNDLTYTRDATISGLIIGSKMPDRQVAAFLLLFDSPRPKLGADEVGLLRASLQTLTEFVETNRREQEQEALEHRLEHAQRLEAIGTLAGGIAHEFNNVLGAILGYGEMALQLLRRPSMTRHYVQEILTSGERAKHIVDQILTFSRKRERAMKPFSVTEAVADILPLLHVTLGNKVTLTAHLCEKDTVIVGSPIEVHQMVMNLCKNAMEASARGQDVRVEVTPVEIGRKRVLSHGEISPGDYVRLSVEDQGPGIPEHVLPHVFEPFYTTKSTSGGTGLGLSAVHGSVCGFGGAIHVQSSAGSGTRFDLFFPASRLAPLPLKSFFDERAVPTGKGESVAILESDRSLLEMYEEKVAALGYEPIGYSSMAALQRAMDSGSVSADLTIVDANALGPDLPLEDLDLVLPKGRYLLLIACERELERGDPLMLASILKKPFSSRALAHAIFDRISVTS